MKLQTFALSSLPKPTLTKLAKLKVSDLLELIISYVPKGYIDTTPLSTLAPQNHAVLRVRIDSAQSIGYGANARLKISASMLDFDEGLEMMIFHAKGFHRQLFGVDSELYVMGRLEVFMGHYQMTQPKVITQIGTISLQFKTTAMRAPTLQELLQSLISTESLRAFALPDSVIEKIVEIFHPNAAFMSAYNATNALPEAHYNAIKFVEIYRYLRILQSKKLQIPARFICENDPAPFISSLPFALTEGQRGAIEDIRRDLASPNAARRLIMGDVGCGKTIVVLAAVMMCYPRQAILMAPTTILAQQLYNEAKRLLPKTLNLALITAKTPSKPKKRASLFEWEQALGLDSELSSEGSESSPSGEGSEDSGSKGSKEARGECESSEVIEERIEGDLESAHFIIGTQALLFRELSLPNLALVMSDEQHRFGTNQRYKLQNLSSAQSLDSDTPRAMRHAPHVLQFSATPIPRTLAMMNANFIDMSVIKDLPFAKDITTSIIDKSGFKALLAHLKSEVAKGHQAIIVYPLVKESKSLDYLSLEEGQGFWERHFEGVYCTSGQDKNKQEVINAFAANGSLLLATTLIEVGISLPRVSTIIIVAPERLGLATLHQLRGRVSRNGLKGYCYLYTHNVQNERLRAFASSLSGFEIAELDLQYRNSGDLLSGDRQSGNEFLHINLAQDEGIIKEASNLVQALYNQESKNQEDKED